MKAFCLTDRGKVRGENQDSVYASGHLFAVADGMGGHKGGKEASNTAISLLAGMLENQKPDKAALSNAIDTINSHLFTLQENNNELQGMGTTLSAIWADKQTMLIGHVGDSRIYLLRNGELTQITQDHSLVAELIKNGFITALEAVDHPYRNVITRALGTDRSTIPDLYSIPSFPTDRWLICSDGLHGMVEFPVIRSLMMRHSIEDAGNALLQKALDNGGKDNISLVIVCLKRRRLYE